MLTVVLTASLVSVVVVQADREQLLKPQAEYVRWMLTQKEKELDRAKADLAASPKSKSRQKEVDDLTAEVARVNKDPVAALKEATGTSPIGAKAGTLVYAVSERAKVISVDDEVTVLEVLSYTGGPGGGRYPTKSEGFTASGITYHGASVPVLDRFTVLTRLPGLKKGSELKLGSWYRIVETGGTKDKPTATAIPFRFTASDSDTLRRLVTELKGTSADKK
jgi:hypothetical protein